MKIPTELHVYPAIIVEVIDGDTIVADIDLGFGLWRKNQHIRLLGCNCPEVHGDTKAKGEEAKQFTIEWILGKAKKGTPLALTAVVLQTFVRDFDAFGRVLARVWLKDAIPNSEDLSTVLINTGHAIPFMEEGFH